MLPNNRAYPLLDAFPFDGPVRRQVGDRADPARVGVDWIQLHRLVRIPVSEDGNTPDHIHGLTPGGGTVVTDKLLGRRHGAPTIEVTSNRNAARSRRGKPIIQARLPKNRPCPLLDALPLDGRVRWYGDYPGPGRIGAVRIEFHPLGRRPVPKCGNIADHIHRLTPGGGAIVADKVYRCLLLNAQRKRHRLVSSDVQAAGLGQDQVVPSVKPATAGRIECRLAGKLRQTVPIQGDALALRRIPLSILRHQFDDTIPAGWRASIGTFRGPDADRLGGWAGKLLGEGSGTERAALVGNGLAVILIEREATGHFEGIDPNDQFVASGAVRPFADNVHRLIVD